MRDASNGVEPIPYPIRINRYLALVGVASRRQADLLILDGLISINGKKANVGDIVKNGDTVKIADGASQDYTYLIYNKPRGLVTHSAQKSEKEVSVLYKGKRLPPIGRLDKDSEGLLILSDDGRITDRLLNPRFDHEKEYVVDVDKPLQSNFKNKMEKGVQIERYLTKKCKVKVMGGTRFSIVITEGKKHQIRRMCAAMGYQIKNLRRVRIGSLKIGALKPNTHRELTTTEKNNLLKEIGL